MPDVVLAEQAEIDLLEVGRYTALTWNLEQAERYLRRLQEHFEKIAKRQVLEKPVFEHRSDLKYSHCQRHVVFFAREDDSRVLIIAILHERMDLLNRLRDRL
ncbi:MAG: type II toxin-antitoxin system RelE/ParE family toxin [Planctomycetes bacterium]|nr:type II toxin-antitoxin system RelE/ParE family toxin [Planctomycetota bacterium]